MSLLEVKLISLLLALALGFAVLGGFLTALRLEKLIKLLEKKRVIKQEVV